MIALVEKVRAYNHKEKFTAKSKKYKEGRQAPF
jgi:hypothetical protein